MRSPSGEGDAPPWPRVERYGRASTPPASSEGARPSPRTSGSEASSSAEAGLAGAGEPDEDDGPGPPGAAAQPAASAAATARTTITSMCIGPPESTAGRRV